MQKSIVKNLVYNIILQFATLIFPLLTLPYVSRILGADGIGVYSYTYSISHYFVLLGTIGLSVYGNRQIAYTRDDKDRMSKTFWSIFILRIITAGLATVVYILIFSHANEYKEIFIIQSINIVAAMVDITWLYMGLEDFKKTVTRNLAIKVVCVLLIFIFVKKREDLPLYIALNALMILLGNLIMWIYIPKVVHKVKIGIRDIYTHLIPSIKLFIPQIAIQIYVVLDKTMIGLLSNVTEVGYYEQSEKIVKSILAFITSIGTVMLPRMSNLFANGDNEQISKYLNNSLKGVAYFAIPMTMGLSGISFEFVPWFFGENFDNVKYIIPILSPILFFISMSNVMGMQYLLPTNRTKEFTISVTTGALINLLLNLILITKLNTYGACIGTIVAEFSVMVIQYIYLRKEINIKEYIGVLIKYMISGWIMLIIIRCIGFTIGSGIITTIIQIFAGVITYVITLYFLKEKYNTLLFAYIYYTLNKMKFAKYNSN